MLFSIEFYYYSFVLKIYFIEIISIVNTTAIKIGSSNWKEYYSKK